MEKAVAAARKAKSILIKESNGVRKSDESEMPIYKKNKVSFVLPGEEEKENTDSA